MSTDAKTIFMTGSDSQGSPLESVSGTAGQRVTEAFSTLGNELRLSILLALWEAFDPFVIDNSVPFSELREQVGSPDSGQFNYHLNQLVGHFVRDTDNGYELRRAGLQLVRTVLAGAGIEVPSFEPTDLDIECSNCGAGTELTYVDEWLYIVCTECEGFYESGHDRPSGILAGVPFEPAGFTNRTPQEMWQASRSVTFSDILLAIEGVCNTCSGPMDCALDICSDHTAQGVCENCGRRAAIHAQFVCPVCKNHHTGPPRYIVAVHPAAIAFYYSHGISLLYEVDDFESIRQRTNLIGEHEQQLVSEDPVRVQVTIRYETDELQLILDEEMNVIEVN